MLTKVHARVSGAFRAALLTAMVTAGLASGAGAATVTLQGSDRTDIAGAQAARDSFLASHKVENLRTETFAGKPARNGQNGSTNPAEHRGRQLREPGRHRLGRLAYQWRQRARGARRQYHALGPVQHQRRAGRRGSDSNDTHGMKWDIGAWASSTASASS